MKYQCPQCGQHISTDTGTYGSSVNCPTCAGSFQLSRENQLPPPLPQNDSLSTRRQDNSNRQLSPKPRRKKGSKGLKLATISIFGVIGLVFISGFWIYNKKQADRRRIEQTKRTTEAMFGSSDPQNSFRNAQERQKVNSAPVNQDKGQSSRSEKAKKAIPVSETRLLSDRTFYTAQLKELQSSINTLMKRRNQIEEDFYRKHKTAPGFYIPGTQQGDDYQSKEIIIEAIDQKLQSLSTEKLSLQKQLKTIETKLGQY